MQYKINGTLVEIRLITDKVFSHPKFSKLLPLLGRVLRQQVGFQILEGRFLPLVQFLRIARVSIVAHHDLILAPRSLRLDRLQKKKREIARTRKGFEKFLSRCLIS